MIKLLIVLCVARYASGASPLTVQMMLNNVETDTNEFRNFNSALNVSLKPLRAAASSVLGKFILGTSTPIDSTKRLNFKLHVDSVSLRINPGEVQNRFKNCLKGLDFDAVEYLNYGREPKCNTYEFQISLNDAEWVQDGINSVILELVEKKKRIISCPEGLYRDYPTSCHEQIYSEAQNYYTTKLLEVQKKADDFASYMRTTGNEAIRFCQDTRIISTGDYLLDNAIDCVNIEIFYYNSERMKTQ